MEATVASSAADTGRIKLVDADGNPAGVVLAGVSGARTILTGPAGQWIWPEEVRPGDKVRVTLAGAALGGPLRATALVTVRGPEGRARRVRKGGWHYSFSRSNQRFAVAMIFPVIGGASWHDTWLSWVAGQPHVGQDLVAPKMRPLVACFPGVVYLLPKRWPRTQNTVVLVGDGGWQALYTHLNDDLPGTNNSRGTPRYTFAPGLRDGARVVGGQLLGWVGNSGTGGAHLHFELRRAGTGVVYNAKASLKMAQKIAAPRTRAVLRSVRPRRGEVRIDGFVRAVDTGRNVMSLSVRSRTKPDGTRNAATQPQQSWIKLGRQAEAKLIGDERVTLDLASLAKGDYIATVGTPGKTSLAARVTYVERTGFIPAVGAVEQPRLGELPPEASEPVPVGLQEELAPGDTPV